MNILVTGAAGFLGARLVRRLLDDPAFAVERLTAIDLPGARFPLPDDPRLQTLGFDLSAGEPVPGLAEADLIFHLAAAVSGACEADMELGLAANLAATLAMLEQVRAAGRRPGFVFSSSIAVYGGALPAVVPDDFHLTPMGSYGAQKAAIEQIVADHGRRGFLRARSLRLPTISVRSGAANAAASSFASAVIREPLAGRDYVCPAPADTAIWLLSPERAVEAFVHAARVDDDDWGSPHGLALPGITVTVAEMIAALGRIAGQAVAARVSFEPDPVVTRLAKGWPGGFEARRALALGFAADADIDEVISAYMAEVGLVPRA